MNYFTKFQPYFKQAKPYLIKYHNIMWVPSVVAGGFTCFVTTLTQSPHNDFDVNKVIGRGSRIAMITYCAPATVPYYSYKHGQF